MKWNPSTDMFSFKVRINFSKKINGIRKGVDIHASEVSEKFPSQLTKREILSQMNGFFYHMGLGAAFTVKAKILWRELWIGDTKSLSWDEHVPDNQCQNWIEFFREMFQMQDIRFHRSIKPSRAKDVEPILILFSDASNRAYGSCAYIRWEMADGKFSCRLVAARSKVCPMKVISTVRSEMNREIEEIEMFY